MPDETIKAMASLRESLLPTQHLTSVFFEDFARHWEAALPSNQVAIMPLIRPLALFAAVTEAQNELARGFAQDLFPRVFPIMTLNVPKVSLTGIDALKQFSAVSSSISAKVELWGADNPLAITRFIESDASADELVEVIGQDEDVLRILLQTARVAMTFSPQSRTAWMVSLLLMYWIAHQATGDAELLAGATSLLYGIPALKFKDWQESERADLMSGK